jgi:hypothetical protein
MAMPFCNPPDRTRVVWVSRASYQAPVPGHRRRILYARVPAHVAPLGLVKTRPLRLQIFASFCANGAVFAPFSL